MNRASGFKPGNSADAHTIGYEDEMSPTLLGGGNTVPAVMIESHPCDSRVTLNESGICQTLTGRMGTGGGNTPLVMSFDAPSPQTAIAFAVNQRDEVRDLGDAAGTVNAQPGMKQQTFVIDSLGSNAMKSENPESGVRETDVAETLTTQTPNPGGRGGNVVAYALEGNASRPSHKGAGIGEDISYTLNATEQHAVAIGIDGELNASVDKMGALKSSSACGTGHGSVAAVDFRNMVESEEVNGTLQAKADGGYNYNSNNTLRDGAAVRRLTPLECERLQGFPDNWTKHGHDGAEISDSKRYAAIGNSVAIPCVNYIMQGIVEANEEV